MKIKVKETTVVEKTVIISNIKTTTDPYFNELLEYLTTLEILASSSWSEFKDFLSYKQGGSNRSDLTEIHILEEFNNTLVVRVAWGSCNMFSHIIFKTS